MTSLVGFEALIRGKKVITYGMPFYAGWGLTIDRQKCERRTRRCTLDELVATSFILYPLYLHPKSNNLCEIEVLLEEIQKEKYRYHHDRVYRWVRDFRNGVSRWVQGFFKT
jgi:capsular polysaccharide export protein